MTLAKSDVWTTLPKLEHTQTLLLQYVKSLENSQSSLQDSLDNVNVKIKDTQEGLDSLMNYTSKQDEQLSTQMLETKKALLGQLNFIKTNLETQLSELDDTIEALKDKLAELDDDLKELRDYIDNKDSDTRKWTNDRIAELEETIDKLQKEIEALKASGDKVQFISAIPDYSDGSFALPFSMQGYDVKPGTLSLRFEVRPNGLAEKLAAGFKNSLSLKAVVTITKAAGDILELKILNASAQDDVLTIEASAANLPSVIFMTREERYFRHQAYSASVCLEIEGACGSAVSEYVSLQPTLTNPVATDGDYIDENSINFGQGVTIGGTTWAPVNAGTCPSYLDGLCGAYYNYEQAKSACPSGWRLPTKEELELLIGNYLKDVDILADTPHYTFFGFSGNSSYSEDVPHIFVPLGGSSISSDEVIGQGAYGGLWSSSKNLEECQYLLNASIGSVEVIAPSHWAKLSMNVRCVKQ